MHQNVPKLPEKRRFRTVPFLSVCWFFHYRVYRVSLPLKSQKNFWTFLTHAFKSRINCFLMLKYGKFMNFPSCYAHETWIFRIRRSFYVKWLFSNLELLLGGKFPKNFTYFAPNFARTLIILAYLFDVGWIYYFISAGFYSQFIIKTLSQ